MNRLRAAGLDIGTSGVRLAVVSDGRVEFETLAPLPAAPRTGSAHEQNPFDWWNAVASCLERLPSGCNPFSLGAIAVAATSGTVLLTDGNNLPITEALMYDDGRAAIEAAVIGSQAIQPVMLHSATSPLAKAIWLARHRNIAAPYRLCHQADWVAAQLTGQVGATDENNALKTGYDPIRRQWPAWVRELGVDAAAFPDVHPVGLGLGPVQPAVARRFGLSPACQVVLGTTDSVADYLASGANLPGHASSSLGTTLALKMNSPVPLYDHPAGIYSHRLGDTWLIGGASNVGGAILKEHFSAEEIATLSQRINPETATGLDYYPLVRPGERFPEFDPHRRPQLEPRPAERHLFLQGIFEGIARVEALAYRKLAALTGVFPRVVHSSGGAAHNPVFTRIRSRALGCAVVEARGGGAAAGAAFLAWRRLTA